ncbi:MAG: PEP-CTERM sorting domain-containing protein [Pirellulales bacterium]|nr:PEP-CTERM sorting domain-containing protein [Pirellulales bacterium]
MKKSIQLLFVFAALVPFSAWAQGPVNVDFTGPPGPDSISTGVAVNGDVSVEALVRSSLVGDIQWRVGNGSWNNIFSISVPAPDVSMNVAPQAIDFSATINDTPTGTSTIIQVNNTHTHALQNVSIANTSLNLTPNPQGFALNELTATASIGYPINFSTTILGQTISVDTVLGPEVKLTASASGTLQNLSFQQSGVLAAGTGVPTSLFPLGSYNYPSLGLTGIPGDISTDVNAQLDASLELSFLGLPIGSIPISQGVPTINTGALPFPLSAALQLDRVIVSGQSRDDMRTTLSVPLPVQVLPELPIPIGEISGDVPLDTSIAFPEVTLLSFDVLGQTVSVALRNAALEFDSASGVDYSLLDARVVLGNEGGALNYTVRALNERVVPVPEPSTLALVVLGMIGVAASAARRLRRSA